MINAKKYWIPIHNGKLPRLCFKCGRISHEGKSCLLFGLQNTEVEQFGSWLLAEHSTRRRAENHVGRFGTMRKINSPE